MLHFTFLSPCLILLGGGLLYLHSYALYILSVHMRMRTSFTAVKTVAESGLVRHNTHAHEEYCTALIFT